ncbi:MAG: enoyl-CoA hydratase/isomerase family protein [Tabrizicola sp.]|uniref:enoyl-CoA hydratase/isomerase family protein n=1 Tax=Tabrizicola sp. TaxID=2005166 RepID=UPI0027353D09|nr:enoyl-CoA hydratase/isomerase family protein [Tabrizicola sp.]MDP3262518.1 enoyl-CoA hydratase/isomerase family protein [Tabrizicola sp.]MDP3648462.1 enoyl-CoA hydratase/isomerase family protein [Paracoccaceae bacterium]MDZ4067764.1 enoyl-CoA hydratase/isomerase family protein [Tabrizicola sp.]
MIETSWDGRLCTVTLDRADKANALNRAMLEAMADAVAGASQASVLVLTGRGKVFSAGADLAEMQTGLGTDPAWGRASEALAGFPGLTIAALNGTLAGGAMTLALACDLRIAVPGAAFFYPVMRLGHKPQAPDPARLVAAIGPARARMLLLAGARIGADEALAWGLIDRIADDVMGAALALAADALAASREHVMTLKAMTR